MIPSSAVLVRQLARRFEAGAYTPRSAAAGLPVSTSADGSRWVVNPLTGNDWQRIHVMTSVSPSNNLWGISGMYFDNGPSYALESEIYNVPQNKKIQGSDMNTGLYPGDEILIPGLTPPADVLGQGAGPGDIPTTPGAASPIPTSLPTSWASSPPDGWPPELPWPGSLLPSAPSDPTQPTTADQPLPQPDLPPGVPQIPSGVLPGDLLPGVIPASTTVPSGTTTTTVSTQPATPAKFWTGPKIAVAVGGAVVVLAGVLYLALRKPRRRRS